MEAIQSYHLIKPEALLWRPSNFRLQWKTVAILCKNRPNNLLSHQNYAGKLQI